MIEALSHGFMQNALVAGAAAALACSAVGMFLVLRRYSVFGDSMSHVGFAGVATGVVAGAAPGWAALAAAVAAGVGLERLRKSPSIPADAAVAMMLVSGLAAGLLVVSAAGGTDADLFGYLVGSVLLVPRWEAVMIACVAAGVVASVYALRRQLAHIAFSEEQARAAGVRVDAVNYLFMALAAVAVVASMRVMGVLLISAIIVLPTVSAMMLGRGLRQTAAASAAMSVAAAVSGILASYYFDLPASAAIVAAAAAILLASAAARRLSAPCPDCAARA